MALTFSDLCKITSALQTLLGNGDTVGRLEWMGLDLWFRSDFTHSVNYMELRRFDENSSVVWVVYFRMLKMNYKMIPNVEIIGNRSIYAKDAVILKMLA